MKAVREAVGALEIANYSKHEFNGPEAHAFLDHVLAGRIPGPGRMALAAMFQPRGRVHFCGEHTSVIARGMEGAIESGERAAGAVTKQLA